MPIMISAKRDGFRRCGIRHSLQSRVYADDHFNTEQLLQLLHEPMLNVEIVEDILAQDMDGESELEPGVAEPELLIDPEPDQQPPADDENSVVEPKKPSRTKQKE